MNESPPVIITDDGEDQEDQKYATGFIIKEKANQ
jgi:hypothetical protein